MISARGTGGIEPHPRSTGTTGPLATLTAQNSQTGDQTTTYTYGTTLADSAVASSLLLRRVAYPDSTGPADKISYRYNRQAEQIEMRDQNGTVHQYGPRIECRSNVVLARVARGISPHDRSSLRSFGVPRPDEALADIGELRTIVDELRALQKAVSRMMLWSIGVCMPDMASLPAT